MSTLPASAGRPAAAGPSRGVGAAILLGSAALIGAAYADLAPVVVLGAVTVLLWAILTQRFFLRWRSLLVALIGVILFIPIGRYALPGALPFEMEPYRVMVGLLVIIWVACLLVQREVRYRPSGLALPLGMVAFGLLLSVGTNAERVHSLGVETEVIKGLTFFGSFIVVLLFVSSSIGSRADLDAVLKALVGGGAIVALLAVIESRTGLTPFDSIDRLIPILDYAGDITTLEARGGEFRALGSAQHPIALGASLALLLPLGVYLGRRYRGWIWWAASGALALGVLTTVARTATLMLVVELIVLLILKPRVMFRLWPYALPFLVVVHTAVPGTLGSLKSSFFPTGGLIAEQQAGAGTYGSNRLADLGPGIKEWKKTPHFGQGFGTRITQRSDPKWNSPILDNQWLGWLLETGWVGMAGLLWLFFRSVRRLGRASKKDDSDYGWLLASLAASITAMGIGMTTFDAFGFIQVAILLFIVLGIGAAALRLASVPPRSHAAAH